MIRPAGATSEIQPDEVAEAGGTGAARLWLLALAALVPIAATAAFISVAARRFAGLPPSPTLLAQIVLDWTLWALVAPLIVLLVRRFPLNRPSWTAGVLRHVVIASVVGLAQLALFSAVSRLLPLPAGAERPAFLAGYAATISLWYPYAILIYWTIAVGTHAVVATRRERRREIEAARLHEELTRAELDALRMQLHPHFMGNSLHTISVFVREGRTEEAVEMLVALGDLLNTALRTMDSDTVPLREELDFVRGYLAIEEKRFSDRVTVRESIDPELLDVPVPTMILQPLVENAMRHGIARDRSAGRVEIRVEADGETVALTVRDDGPGPGGGGAPGGAGLGLENLRRRIERLYGETGRLRLAADPEGGARATVRLPRNGGVENGSGSP